MTDETFLKAILANPDDDAPRLEYSDWLVEQGRGERAEFIRVQCRIAELEGRLGECQCRTAAPQSSCRYCDGMFSRERKLLCTATMMEEENRYHIPGPSWRRGFIDAVTCPAETWLAHADAILAAQPVQEVTLTTWPAWGPVTLWTDLDRPAPADRHIVSLGNAGNRLWPEDSNTFARKKPVALSLLERRWATVKDWHLPPRVLHSQEITDLVNTTLRELGEQRWTDINLDLLRRSARGPAEMRHQIPTPPDITC